MKTFGQYEEARRIAIVKDLLKKEPKGGDDRHGMQFETVHEYCGRYNHYRDLQRCNRTWWGYSLHQMHRLGFFSKTAVEAFILTHYYNGQSEYELTRGEKGGFSRKVNRIWDRIENISRTRRNGQLPGVYQIACGGYYDTAVLGFVIATDKDHAVQLGTTLFGGWAGDREIRSEYKDYPQADAIQKAAAVLQAGLDRDLQKEKQRHADSVKKIEDQIKSAQMATLIAMDCAEDIGAA